MSIVYIFSDFNQRLRGDRFCSKYILIILIVPINRENFKIAKYKEICNV